MRQLCKLLVLALLSLAPTGASAGLAFALDANAAKLLDDPANRGLAFGVDGRAGYKLGLVVIDFTPELGAGYLTFAEKGAAPESRILQGYVGARLAFGAILKPSAFAHVGLARLTAGSAPSDTGRVVDGGVALDFTAIPFVNIGVHAAYHHLSLDVEPAKWVTGGAHVGFAL